MNRAKIDYGIDLGTTNSAICRMDKGEATVIKTDVLKDTMPSCVSFTKRQSVKAGDSAFNDMKSSKLRASKNGAREHDNAYIEFKRTMATTVRYHSSFMERDYSSEELSAEVLKALKSFVKDENISSAVITVPAKFTVNQKTATIEAAKLAGFKQCELLQEPIAAAMAYGIKAEDKNGIWMVFDFGGGTFDAALIKAEDGILQVFDTEGDNYLGGKNLDYAIVDNIIIPYLMDNYNIDSIMATPEKKDMLRDAMKTYAEDVKIQLSFKDSEDILSNVGELGCDDDGEELELDLTITQKQAFDVMRPYFQKAVDICKNLLQRNHLSGSQIKKLILVGGPTHSSLIRQMLKEQVTVNVDASIDPMTAVATGAALYASTIDAEVSDEDITMDAVKLEVGYEATSVETQEWVSVKLIDDKIDKVWVEFVRSDKAWSSGKVEIDTMGNVVEAMLLEGRPNSFEILVYNQAGNTIPCFPSEFTIIHGTKVGAAPLPYNIGIAKWSDIKKRGVFKMAKGLEKNKPLPAVGVIENELKTSRQLRPGVEADVLTIPIYQTDDFEEAEGKTASLYNYVADVVITGDDINTLIPDNSDVDITLKVDTSEQMTVSVYFHVSDTTVEKVLNTNKKQSVEEAEDEIRKGIDEAQTSISNLKDSNIQTTELQSELDKIKQEYSNSTEKKMVLENLKKVLRKIEALDSATEWQRIEQELRQKFDALEEVQERFGNDKSAIHVEQLRSQIDKVIRAKDAKIGSETIEQIDSLYIRMTLVLQCMRLIVDCQRRFDSIQWKDRARARQLIDRGLQEANNQPTSEVLHPIARNLIGLMPNDELQNGSGLLK